MAILLTQQVGITPASKHCLYAIELAANGAGAKRFEQTMPADLSFKTIVRNKASPPCSLNDFMDYLVYVEHDAEPLQFFLWYCDYVDRWAKLPADRKALSPIWDGSGRTQPDHVRYSHRRANSERMSKILKIMGTEARNAPELRSTPRRPPLTGHGRSHSMASIPPSSHNPTAQPFREELVQVMRHYISENAIRQLKLQAQDRDACLAAVEYTTHPSALLPAFLLVESALKSRLYPSFIRWSLANSNRPRIIYLRVLASLLIFVGLGVCVTLILSHASRFVRVLSLLLWWPGITILVASWHGLSIMLYLRGLRDIRPWEQFGDKEEQMSEGKNHKEDIEATPPSTPKEEEALDFSRQHEHPDPLRSNRPTHGRTNTAISFSRVDPLRKASMSTFGPANDADAETWVKDYSAKPLFRRVFEQSVQSTNGSLQTLQERIVLLSVIAGGLIATSFTVAAVFVPSAKLF